MLYNKKICSKCRITNVHLINHSTIHYKNNTYRYFLCRNCNSLKARKYYQTKDGKSNIYNIVKKSIKKYPDKQKARSKLYLAVKKGILVRPKKCSNCNCVSERIEGHHVDYSKPLNVIWLCKVCHFIFDKKML